jgi:hypothetical protein
MSISGNLLEINNDFTVEGYRNKKWERFQPGRNYEAFLIERK